MSLPRQTPTETPTITPSCITEKPLVNMSTKVAFITGATAGFGEATARRFVKEGWKVIITGRRTERLEALQADLGKDVCHPVTLDVTDRKGVEACFANLPEGFKEIDVLVNNAGLALGVDSVDQGDVDSWEQMIDTNIKGLLYVTRAALPSMVCFRPSHLRRVGRSRKLQHERQLPLWTFCRRRRGCCYG